MQRVSFKNRRNWPLRALHRPRFFAVLILLSCAGLVAVTATRGLRAQGTTDLRFAQDRDRAPLRALSPEERTELGDPFFNLVLKGRADVMSLSEIEALLGQMPPGQAGGNKPQIFVVDENIVDPARTSRRSVIVFNGVQNGQALKGNVMLSIFFSDAAYPEHPTAIEAMGWDEGRGRYNYYKLDNSGTVEGDRLWRFRGSSVGADKLLPGQRTGTCLSCHASGAPIMKEMAFPWNNWHSFASQATYLQPSNPQAWRVASDVRFKNALTGAEQLEQILVGSLNRFNQKRLRECVVCDAAGKIAVGADGRAKVSDGLRLLRPIFQTREVNIGSSKVPSGLHALGGLQNGPAAPVPIPMSFFLNANLIHGNGTLGIEGLRLPPNSAFEQAATLQPAEYRHLIESSHVGLARRPGDANFAWLTPEVSQVDSALVDRLLKEGIVSPAFVAAVLSVDLENPILSASRADLLRFVPQTFTFKPRALGAPSAAHPDEMTRTVIATLQHTNPAQNSTEGEFLANLRAPDPVSNLKTKVAAYQARLMGKLNAPATRSTELERLHNILVGRRRAVNAHPIFGHLNETEDRLFPLPVASG